MAGDRVARLITRGLSGDQLPRWELKSDWCGVFRSASQRPRVCIRTPLMCTALTTSIPTGAELCLLRSFVLPLSVWLFLLVCLSQCSQDPLFVINQAEVLSTETWWTSLLV